MARLRVSTTVDEELWHQARALYEATATDASVVEAALKALLAAHRRAQVDALYEEAYAEHPVDTPDEWGDLDSFGSAAERARTVP